MSIWMVAEIVILLLSWSDDDIQRTSKKKGSRVVGKCFLDLASRQCAVL